MLTGPGQPIATDWDAEITGYVATDASQPSYKNWIAWFALWVSADEELRIKASNGGFDVVPGPKTDIEVSVNVWNGSQKSNLVSQIVPLDWDSSLPHSVRLEKRGKTYTLYFDDVQLLEYEDAFLTAEPKIGFHTYGPTVLDDFVLAPAGCLR